MNIRRATKADTDSIDKLIKKFPDSLLPRSRAEVEELADHFWLAYVDGPTEPIGCCCLEVYSKKIAEVRSLCVLPEYRHQGVGEKLVLAAVDAAKSEKVHEVFAVTSALDFFTKIGFGPCLNEKYALFWSGTEGKKDN
jgi:amino-acid N-acetyltransferase